MSDWSTPALEYAQVVYGSRIHASEFDVLSHTMMEAWKHPHKWQRCLNYDDGIKRVICIPKISKLGVRYWLWGYDLTVGKIHWQNTRIPYDS